MAKKKKKNEQVAKRKAAISNNDLQLEYTNDVATVYQLPNKERLIKATPRHAKARILRRGTRARHYGK